VVEDVFLGTDSIENCKRRALFGLILGTGFSAVHHLLYSIRAAHYTIVIGFQKVMIITKELFKHHSRIIRINNSIHKCVGRIEYAFI